MTAYCIARPLPLTASETVLALTGGVGSGAVATLRSFFWVAAWVLCCLLAPSTASLASEPSFAMVINHGRVIDPETGLDAVRHIGINDGRIVRVAEQPLQGAKQIDASGLVVAPGFIDLHTHSPTPLGQYYQAFDGVTTALELEAGHYPLLSYAGQISATPMINYGASAGYVSMRIFEKNGLRFSAAGGTPQPVGLKGWITALRFFLTDLDSALAPSLTELANGEELQSLRAMLEADLDAGALGIGLALDYFSDAIQSAEMNMIFAVAGARKAPVFVHIRRGIDGDPAGLEEVLELAETHTASLHICHVSHNAVSNIEGFLALIRQAQERGVDVTTEVLPYNAGSALISSAVFGRDWQTIFNISYGDVEWAATGERLTEQTFADYRSNQPQGQVVHHYLQEAWTQRALREPGVIVVSDLLAMESVDKNVAPHNGAFSKVLGRYVREEGLLELSEAIARMTLLPARRMETVAPLFARKGRIQEGADADVTVFDAKLIDARATYRNAYQESVGVQYLLVNGSLVIAKGKLVDGSHPGRRLLAAAAP